MRIKSVSVALAISLCCLATSAAQPANTIDKLGWTAGCWEGQTRAGSYAEQWMKPAAGLMLGMSRTMRDNKISGFEFLQLREKEGNIVYIAQPEGGKPTEFKLVKLTLKTSGSGLSEVVFENLQHDFPQRIIYRREGDKLTARIEGSMNGQTRGIDFPMTKAKCE